MTETQWGGQAYTAPAAPVRRNGLATAALVLGLIGVPTGFFFVGGVFGALAVVLGFLALGRVRRGETDGRGVAIAGIVTGAIAVLVAAGMLVFVLAIADSGSVRDYRDCARGAHTQEDLDACRNQFQRDLGGD
jgi:hypothetical protein